jgi:hypothetical protein
MTGPGGLNQFAPPHQLHRSTALNMKRTFIALIILGCSLAVVPNASSQTSTKQDRCATGIEGRTTGIQGWIIVDATVHLIDRKTKQATDVKTGDNGEYLACLASGTYDVIANAAGYKPARRKSIKVVSLGRNVVDIVMTPSGLVIVDRLHP